MAAIAVRLNIRISERLLKRMRRQIEADGYGPHGKSKWIREAFVQMLKADPKLELIGQGDLLDGKNSLRNLITVQPALKEALDSHVSKLRRGMLHDDAGVSILLRSAIRYRLEHPGLFLAKPSSPRRRGLRLRGGVDRLGS